MSSIPFTFLSDGEGNSITIAAFSQSGADFTIAMEGQPTVLPITPTGIGKDGLGPPSDSFVALDPLLGQGIFVASTTFSSLNANTRYAISVTQNSVTREGSVRTDPGLAADFSFFVINCDGHDGQGDGRAQKTGGWKYVRDYMENGRLPTAAIIRPDDHGYTDSIVVADTDPSGSGAYCNQEAQLNETKYIRALGYAAYLGLLETYTDASPTGGYLYFHDEDRRYCHENGKHKWSIGDHECRNNPEETDFVTRDISALITSSVDTFNEVIGAAMSFIDTVNGNAWVSTLGPVELVAFDRVEGITTQVYKDDATQTPQNASMLSGAQIADIKGAFAGTSPFSCLVMSAGSYFLMNRADRQAAWTGTDYTGLPAWDNSAQLGAQQPLHGYTNANVDGYSGSSDWDSLIRDATDGLAKQANDNNSTFFAVHGDAHHMRETYHYYPETSGLAALELLIAGAGTINSRGQHRLHPSIRAGNNQQGSHHVWVQDEVVRTQVGDTNPQNTMLRCDVIQSEGPRRIEINYIQVDNQNDASSAVVKRQTVVHENSASTGPEHMRGTWI